MIDYLYGIFNSKSKGAITLEINGIGYSISVPFSNLSRFPTIGNLVKIYIVENTSGMYGGPVYLYGFLTKEEREMYLLIKEKVPGTGAKKALEYMNKVSMSFRDFKTAITSKNFSMLNKIFGFTKKTSDKLITALNDKISTINALNGDDEKIEIDISGSTIILETIASLMSLGYKEQQAKNAVNAAYEQCGNNATLEDLIRKSLRYM
ncbi:MAG: Holliday junction branch migration protein RuvA [Endomicrobium sp.]|jgi:Holliday junction DNA helicase RuvA|nr:Holliday junction branch migration protein RuvA [Endomicrobium sp.]